MRLCTNDKNLELCVTTWINALFFHHLMNTGNV